VVDEDFSWVQNLELPPYRSHNRFQDRLLKKLSFAAGQTYVKLKNARNLPVAL